MREFNLIISPVGTSILTGNAGPDSAMLRESANLKENELSPEQRARIDEIAEAKRALLMGTNRYEDFKRLSAELNGIFSYKTPDNNDIHILIATDTYQGGKAAELIKETLQRYCCNVQVKTMDGLNTRSMEDFNNGIDKLMEYLHDTIEGYLPTYNVVFNLTGGFKAIIGYMNLAAMLFHAHEVLYIFEMGSELIRIPRMPIKIDEEIIRNNKVLMALLSVESKCAMEISKLNEAGIETDGLYESLFEKVEIDGASYISLSLYGKILWDTIKDDVYGELLSFPYIEYTERFKKSFIDGRSRERFQEKANEALARIAAIMIQEGSGTFDLCGNQVLEYERLKGGIGHFRISDRPSSYRGVCVPIDGAFKMIDCGGHDDIVLKYANTAPEEALMIR